MNELHAVEAVGDGGIVERAVVGRTARLHRQNGADDVLVDVGKGDDQSLGMAGGDAAVRAGLLGDITGTAGQGLRGLALGGCTSDNQDSAAPTPVHPHCRRCGWSGR